MELKEFQGLALRTESSISGIKLNRSNLITLLKVVVEVTEILDGIKKAAFYNKNAKLEDELPSRLATLVKLIEILSWQSSGRGPVGAILDPEETISNVDPRVFHGILGIVTESGELAAALLKSVENPEHVIDAVNIQEEMSDIAWYKAILHDTLGLDWNQGLANVIEKLRIRYPDKYTDEYADNRDLQAERSALETGFLCQSLPKLDTQENHIIATQEFVDDYNAAVVANDFIKGKFDPKDSEVALDNNAENILPPNRNAFFIEIPDNVSTEDVKRLMNEIKTEICNRSNNSSLLDGGQDNPDTEES